MFFVIISKKRFAFHATQNINLYIENNGIELIEDTLKERINNLVLEHIKSNILVDSEVLIISASPDKYISHIAIKSRNWQKFFK